MDKQTLLKKLDRIEELPTLPAIAVQVNTMLQDYDTSIKELTDVIEKDQAIVPKILKLVNSAFFGFRSKISSLSHAIVILGYNTVRNAIISVAIIDALAIKGSKEFDIKKFWVHSIAVAVTSRHLATETKLATAEDAFTGGLLHDIGKLILFQFFPDQLSAILKTMKEEQFSFFMAEKHHKFVSHARIGAHLTKRWQLPEILVDVVKYHHFLSKSVADYHLNCIVLTADVIVNQLFDEEMAVFDPEFVVEDAYNLLKPQINLVSEWFPEIKDQINSACSFFLEE